MTLKVEIDWGKNGYDVGVGEVTTTGGGGDGFGEAFGEAFGGGSGITVQPAAGLGDDVTNLVRSVSNAVTAEYGRDQSTALAPTVSGRASVVLDNRDRRFSPRNPDSPLFGLIKPARPVRIRRTAMTGTYSDVRGDIYGESTFTLFVGHTDDSPINPDIDSRTVALSMVDSLADLRGQTISTPLYSGVRSGDAINLILDAAGWPADLRDIDPGGSVFPWWWEDNTDALTAVDKVVRSEGPPALMTIGGGGEIIFRDRHHRLINAQSLTPQSIWRGSGAEPVMGRPFTYDEAWRNIVNTATVNVEVKRLGDLTQLWTTDSIIELSAGETRLITAATTSPFAGAIPPVHREDFELTSGTVRTSLIRDSGASATIILTAGPAGANLPSLQLRGQPLTVTNTVQVTATDVGSISEYGPRAFADDLPWCGVEDARAVTAVTVAYRAAPLPIVSARFMVGRSPVKAGQILSRDLSDRVRIVESETVLDDEFYVESIRHELTGEEDHAVTFGLEAVPYLVANVFMFDTAGHGFDQGEFGADFDDPADIFLFDTAGRGFDQGKLAH